jgi:(p)ppGpp synthase/HD superfamily hydrolase
VAEAEGRYLAGGVNVVTVEDEIRQISASHPHGKPRSEEFWERFDEATIFATVLHRDQRRKGVGEPGIPYVAHLFSVTALVLAYGRSDDAVIASLLHDSLEDQGNRYPGGREALKAEISRRFGTKVREIVVFLTDDGDVRKPAEDEPGDRNAWLERKKKYIAHIGSAPGDVRLVCCADKLHNARAILRDHRWEGEPLWCRFRTGRKEDQVWYYQHLARQLREGGKTPTPLLDDLDGAVKAMHEL